MILLLTTVVAIVLTILKLLGHLYIPWGLIGLTFIAVPLIVLALAVLVVSSQELIGYIEEIGNE